jgi:hypothetical protein
MKLKQQIGRAIRSKESFEDFVNRLNESLWELVDSFTSYHRFKRVDYKQTVLSEKDLQRLLLEIQSRELLVLPSCDGFKPQYRICEVVGNPLFEYELKVLIRINSTQIPKEFTFKDMKKIFSSKRNLELAALVNESISLNDSSYFY